MVSAHRVQRAAAGLAIASRVTRRASRACPSAAHSRASPSLCAARRQGEHAKSRRQGRECRALAPSAPVVVSATSSAPHAAPLARPAHALALPAAQESKDTGGGGSKGMAERKGAGALSIICTICKSSFMAGQSDSQLQAHVDSKHAKVADGFKTCFPDRAPKE